MMWKMLHPTMNMARLGYIPSFLFETDPRSASEQIAARYIAGWRPFIGFERDDRNVLHFDGDPPIYPLAITRLREEVIIFYEHEWLMILQPDGSYEVARID